jgi:nucleoid-associated protein YgaU
VLLAVISMVLSLIFGSPAPQAAASQLPATQPGLGRNEGTFLITDADDGTRAAYFIAGNIRHGILSADLQLELEHNPLWPVRSADRDDVLAYAEGAPVGAARAGLLSVPVDVAEQATDESVADEPASNQLAAQVYSDQPTTYVLKPGDNLTRISEQYGTTIEAIVAANHLTNANRIFVGQTLIIPNGAGS